jgi:hypothetical protein
VTPLHNSAPYNGALQVLHLRTSIRPIWPSYITSSMLWSSLAFLALPAVVRSHSHHAHEQQSFSQERLDELERKWGTDVSSDRLRTYELGLTAIVGFFWDFNVRPSSAHTLLDPSPNHLRHRHPRRAFRYCRFLPARCTIRSSSYTRRLFAPNVLPRLQPTSWS